MKVLVCGGRDYSCQDHVWSALDTFHAACPITRLITGAQRKWDRVRKAWIGADYLAETWARRRSVPYVGHPANWDRYGRAAGPIRNGEMLEEEAPEVVLSFPGGDGTADMVSRARAVGIGVLEQMP